MNCPNCGIELNGSKCVGCGQDIALSSRLYNLSVRYYNKALLQTRDGRYTEAMHSLRKSVAFRKECTDAQNLLGLVYHRIGRQTEAVICWQYSLSLDNSRNNQAYKLLRSVAESKDETAKLDSIKNYNMALSYFKQGNTDMAVMTLKKAIESNKYFVDAHNLMALCRMQRQENAEALRSINRVLKMDKDNETALMYMRELRPERFKEFEQVEPDTKEYGKKTAKLINAVYSAGNKLFSFLFGMAVCAIIAGVLVLPAITSEYKAAYKDSELKYSIDIANREEQLANADKTIAELRTENENLSSRLYTTGEQELQKRLKTLNEIQSQYSSGNVTQAADSLLSLGITGFSASATEQYNSLRQKLLPEAAKKNYDLGENARLRGDTESATLYFQKCISCCTGNEEVRYSALYQLARIANNSGDYALAKQYYQEVAENHPLDKIKKEAEKYLSEH